SKAPADALAAAAAMLETGEVRYTPAGGTPALKQAIIQYTEKFYGTTVEPANVIASNGAKQSIMVALQAVLDPKDEVIFPVPYWVSYPEMVKLCGAVPVPALAEDGSFHPRIADIERKVTARTKAVMINSPNNPSGAMYAEEFVAELVDRCEKRGLYLIMDDIYHRLVFDGRTPISCYTYAREPMETSRLIVINGVSKQYAMTGFRIGWAVASKSLIRVMTNIQGHQTSCPSAIGQHAAVAAIEGEQSSVEDLRRTLESNRNALMAEFDSFSGVAATRPDGTFYCFADFRHYEKDSTKLAKQLLEKALVVTVPGVEFGMDGHLRISTCGSLQDITEGVARMKWVLDPSAPDEIRIGDRTVVRDWM
ncbi:MAG: pyridoxal phosphate-dependent aminotransferase, partial [Gemmatimonadota bacterium]|nr:pyridoxal phosphate-dependent aminotransferase [Gemmatimonadota bacterium]